MTTVEDLRAEAKSFREHADHYLSEGDKAREQGDHATVRIKYQEAARLIKYAAELEEKAVIEEIINGGMNDENK